MKNFKILLAFMALLSAFIFTAMPSHAYTVNDNLRLATPGVITNQAASGVLPILPLDASSWDVAQSTAGLTFTLPALTASQSGNVQVIGNTGTAPFTIYGVQIGAGQSAMYKWNGASWAAATAAPAMNTPDFWRDTANALPNGAGDHTKEITHRGKAQIGSAANSNASVLNVTGGAYNQMQITNSPSAWGLLLGHGDGSATGGYHGLNTAAIINVPSAPMHLGTGNAVGMTIDTANKVGIGTSTPTARLQVTSGTASDSGLRLENVAVNVTLPSTALNTAIGIDANGKVVLSNTIGSSDTRAVNSAPQTYPLGMTYEFKQCATIGVASSGTYCGLETRRFYGFNADFSGGQVFGVATEMDGATYGRKWSRKSTNATAWGAWQQEAPYAETILGAASPVGAPPLGAKEYLRTDLSMTTHAVNAAGTAWQALPRGLQKQQTLTGGGTVSWNANTLSFTNRFITIGAGRGIDNISSSGYYDINMPAVGTVITGVCGAPNQTVTAAGIPFTGGSSWHVLWYYLPTGAQTFNAANYRMSGYSADCLIPDNAVMIAAWNTDDNKLRLGTGEVLQPNSTNQPYFEREATRRLFAGQNWLNDATKRTDWGAGTQGYDAVTRRMVFSGAGSAMALKTRLPYRADGYYVIDAKTTKISGTGTTYIGFIGVDANGTQGSVTAWQVAGGVTQAAGTSQVFSLSTLGSSLAIPATSQYVDVVVLANYTGSGDTAVDYVDFRITEGGAVIPPSVAVGSGVAGAFDNGNPSATGAIVITTTIPAASTTMFRFKLDAYSYDATSAWSAEVGGYTYIGNTFHNTIFSGYRKHPNVTPAGNVKFGVRNGFVVLILGTATSVWSYPKLAIRDVIAGHGGSNASYTKGWTIALEGAAALATITNLATVPVN